jgi:hypothetical protein
MARNEMEQAQFEAEEKLRASQTQFDPNIHGAGTIQLDEPSNLKELYLWTKKMFERISLGQKGQPVSSSPDDVGNLGMGHATNMDPSIPPAGGKSPFANKAKQE